MTNNGRAGAGAGFHDLTAETNRWVHAARTWPKAWQVLVCGVLHDSEQDLATTQGAQAQAWL